MSRVFVVQEQPHVNITPAREYGELIFMLPPGTHSFNATRLVHDLRDCVEHNHFTSSDFVLLIGDPVAIGAAVAVSDQWLQDKWNADDPPPKLKVLKWDRQERCYLPIELPLAE